jgi:hypothetical protein
VTATEHLILRRDYPAHLTIDDVRAAIAADYPDRFHVRIDHRPEQCSATGKVLTPAHWRAVIHFGEERS